MSDQLLTDLGYVKTADHGEGNSSWEKVPQAEARPAFGIGETVYFADACAYAQVRAQCPVCFGKLFVTLILGDESQEQIECSACGLGYDGPQGWINEHAATSSVTKGTISGISRSYSGAREWDYEVGGMRREHVFRTHDEAEAKRVELFAAAQVSAQDTKERIIAGKKKGAAWSVRYHREHIKDLERRIEWHRSKLNRPVEAKS